MSENLTDAEVERIILEAKRSIRAGRGNTKIFVGPKTISALQELLDRRAASTGYSTCVQEGRPAQSTLGITMTASIDGTHYKAEWTFPQG